MNTNAKLDCFLELARLNLQFYVDSILLELTNRQRGQQWRRIRERYAKEHPGYGIR